MEFQTLKELYANSINTYGSRSAFSMLGRESMTYNDFDDRVDYVRGILLGAGLSSGDKVALLSSNMPNWNVCYFAIVTSGMVAVPILPDFSGPELDAIIAHSDAKALMVSDKLFSRLSRETIDRMNIVIRTKNLGILSRKSGALGVMREPKPDDLAVIIYTSGTTSAPKGVMLTHYNLARQIQMGRDLFAVLPDDVFLSILPLSHTYECSLGMLLPFMCGASVVYIDRPPTASNLLPELFGGRLRFFGIGGAKLDAEAERFLLEGRFPYAIGYGLTETAPLLAGATPDKVRLGSTGPMLKGVEARLEDVNELGEGELVVKSPCTMQGYYKNPELTAEVFTHDHWFRTRDLAAFDNDGYLYIKGRLGNMILGPNGENIYPEDIESVLNSHFLVSDSIVQEENGKLIALVHFDREQLRKRYQELRHDMAEIKAELIRYVNAKVNKSSKIASIREQEEAFEKTPSHKIKRYLYTSQHKKTAQPNNRMQTKEV